MDSQRLWFAPKLYGSLQPASLDVRDSVPDLLGAHLINKLVAQRIPISLLELNTFGHAICTLFIYLLWWEKPFEVDIPTIVESDVLLDMYALTWVNTPGPSPFIQSTTNTYREYLQANNRFEQLDNVSFHLVASRHVPHYFAERHKTTYSHVD